MAHMVSSLFSGERIVIIADYIINVSDTMEYLKYNLYFSDTHLLILS